MDKKKLAMLLAVLAVVAVIICVIVFGPKSDTQNKGSEPTATAVVEEVTAAPAEEPAAEEPAEAPAEEAETTAEEQVEAPAEAPAEEAAEAPAEDQAKVPAEEAAEEPAAVVPDTLLATVNGKEIRENNEVLQKQIADLQSQVEERNELLDRIIRMIAMQQVMHEQMLEEKIAEAGEEKTAELKKEGQDYWNQVVDSFMSQMGITEESSEEDKIAARADALSYIETNYGYTEETYLEEVVKGQAYQTILDELKAADPELAATEEEIQQAYQDYAAEQREYVGDDAGLYEMYQMYYGQEFYYIPEGYRGITHILLDVDQELLDKWTDLSARYEESMDAEESTGEESEEAGDADEGEPAVTEEPVTAEMVEAARQAILDSKKEKIDEIMAKLKDGAAFEDLIAEYGTDPGMTGDNLKNGYMIHKDSISYVSEFTDAAAALEKVGDVSDPVVSQFGIHILYYLRDVPAGLVDMTDEVREEMRSEIEEERLNLAYSEYFDKWVESAATWTEEGQAWKYDQNVIDEYIAANSTEETDDTEAVDADDIEDNEEAEGEGT